MPGIREPSISLPFFRMPAAPLCRSYLQPRRLSVSPPKPPLAQVVASRRLVMQTKKLKIIPLGGLGEFGMNCLALRWEDDIIVIDAGLMFPESELLGVDIVVPDISYLVENRAHVRAIILTHGHEDHIGGLPWILCEIKVPVYATEFTLAYVDGKLEEHKLTRPGAS